MEVQELGVKTGKKIVLLPGNTMCWRQFEPMLPLLEQKYHVFAVSTDGYDGTGKTTFTTAEASAEKLEAYLQEHLDGGIDLVFGESFGCATALMLFHRQKVRVGAMILSGPQYMDIGPLNGLFAATVPKQQYKLVQSVQSVDKLPLMLRLYTRGDDEKLKAQLRYVAKNISLETLQNCTKEALVLYDKVDAFAPDPEAKVAVWHGAKEPNMKKALAKLRRAFPNAEDHPFAGYGHGEIMSHPEVAVPEIDRFLEQ